PELTGDGRRAAAAPGATGLRSAAGAGRPGTDRVEVLVRGPGVRGEAGGPDRDNDHSHRIGWKEIVVGTHARSTSAELRAYPKDLLQSPLDVTSVDAHLSPQPGADVSPRLTQGQTLQAPDRVADAGFARLIGRHHLGAWVIL